MVRERSGMSPCSKTTLTLLVGVAAVALVANGRDILKYFRLVMMSRGSHKP